MSAHGNNGAGRAASGVSRTAPPSDDLVPVESVAFAPALAVNGNKPVIVVLNEHVLIRDFMVACLKTAERHSVLSFSTIGEWQKARPHNPPPTVILLCAQGRKYAGLDMERDLAALSRAHSGVPIIVMSDVEDFDYVLNALERGARGYIPTSVSLNVALEAIQLVQAGGTFVPANVMMSSKRAADSGNGKDPHSLFTIRQAAVVAAIKQGKANKRIAYELNMRESTVKVHVRNIMRKLNAKNRTEVAMLTSQPVNAT